MSSPEATQLQKWGCYHESCLHLPLCQHGRKVCVGSNEEEAIIAEFVDKGSLDNVIPQLAARSARYAAHRTVVRSLKTSHSLILGNARDASALEDHPFSSWSPSPPYWTLKRYNEHADQLGHVADYNEFQRKPDGSVEELLSGAGSRWAD